MIFAMRHRVAAVLFCLPALCPVMPAGADPAAGRQRCPERVQLGFGETAAEVARRCGVTPEALDRANPGLDRRNARAGVSVAVPRPALPSPALGVTRNGFVPVPTPPGAFGR